MENKKTGYTSQYVSVSGAAKLLGVSANTIRRYEAAGKIISTRTPGGHRKFSTASLQEFSSQQPPSTSELANQYHVSDSTIRRWRHKDTKPVADATPVINQSSTSKQSEPTIESSDDNSNPDLIATPLPISKSVIKPHQPAKKIKPTQKRANLPALLVISSPILFIVFLVITALVFKTQVPQVSTPGVLGVTHNEAIQQGTTIIPAGSQKIRIPFTRPFNSSPVFTVNTSLEPNQYQVTNVTKTEATLRLTQPNPTTLTILWQASPGRPQPTSQMLSSLPNLTLP